MSKPLSPSEVVSAKQAQVPPEVFDAFNELIAQNWNGYQATIKQGDVASLIAAKLHLTDADCQPSTNEVYKRHWLDVEDIYRQAGWVVEYDKPGYCETYPATFTFRKKPTRES